MLRWLDIMRFVNGGNPLPDRKLIRTNEHWRALLSPEQYEITRLKASEPPFQSDMCSFFGPARYACVCCHTDLFDAGGKFENGSGWPSFKQPVRENAVVYQQDNRLGMVRTEVLCNTCDSYLGHVFQDGPMPGGLRYCINATSLEKVLVSESKAIFGGGPCWYTEAIFRQYTGVLKIEAGYSGGHVTNPSYDEICSDQTGHAECIEVTYDPSVISFADLLRIHLNTHNPTTIDRQGEDKGSRYRSVIFYRNQREKAVAMMVIVELQRTYDSLVVTQLEMYEQFYKARDHRWNHCSVEQGQGLIKTNTKRIKASTFSITD